MVGTIIEDFSSYEIKEASIQFLDRATKTQEIGTKFGCVGKYDFETEMKNIQRTCEGVVTDELAKPDKGTANISAHFPPYVIRTILGFHNQGLKKGVFAYGRNSQPKPFVFTAKVLDMYGTTKLIALPNASTTSGYSETIENGGEEVAETELELSAKQDSFGEIVYEAFVDEVEDAQLIEDWLTKFTPEMAYETP
ncbi:phage tail protein [Listeria booriae]|uniref:phage tail protein n=1 Tax=Listeria booriae TaxID=1552123 RepID=UPI00162435EC|nr:phage tail protein [Listeria booriae]MBC1247348.1 phage tail protein [Listeria booriae]